MKTTHPGGFCFLETRRGLEESTRTRLQSDLGRIVNGAAGRRPDERAAPAPGRSAGADRWRTKSSSWGHHLIFPSKIKNLKSLVNSNTSCMWQKRLEPALNSKLPVSHDLNFQVSWGASPREDLNYFEKFWSASSSRTSSSFI